MAEFDAYHNAKRDDFERIVKAHLDGEIAFYEKVSTLLSSIAPLVVLFLLCSNEIKVLTRLRTTRALFDTSPTELDLLMPGARRPSIYERSSQHVNSFTLSAEPLTQPAPHVLDKGRRATIGPMSDAIQGLLGIAAGSGGGSNIAVSGGHAEANPNGGETNGGGSVFGRLW